MFSDIVAATFAAVSSTGVRASHGNAVAWAGRNVAVIDAEIDASVEDDRGWRVKRGRGSGQRDERRPSPVVARSSRSTGTRSVRPSSAGVTTAPGAARATP